MSQKFKFKHLNLKNKYLIFRFEKRKFTHFNSKNETLQILPKFYDKGKFTNLNLENVNTQG